MKKSFGKLFVLTLVLVLGLSLAFVACDKPDENPNAGFGPADGLANAKSFIEASYKGGQTIGSEVLPSIATVAGGNKYGITWTTDNTDVTITNNGDNTVTVALPKYHGEDETIALTGTIIANDGTTVTVTVNYTYKAFVISSWAEYKAACDLNSSADAKDEDKAKIYNVRGYIVGVNADYDSSSVGSLWVQDANGGGYYAYKPTLPADLKTTIENNDLDEPTKRAAINNAFPVGAEVIISGVLKNYNGALEFDSGCTVELTGNTAPEGTLTYTDATADFKAPGEKNANIIKYQGTMVELKGAVLGKVDGLNMYFTIDGVEYICYRNVYLMSEADFDAFLGLWVEGLTADLKGVINVYSGKYQIYPQGLDGCKLQIADLTDAEKVDAILDAVTLKEKYNEDFDLASFSIATMNWAVKSGTGIAVEDGVAKVTVSDADQTVVLTLSVTIGEVTKTKDFTVTVPAPAATFIANALKVGAGLVDKATTEDSYILVGTVSRIKDEYSEQYKNVTFYLSDGTNEIMIYRYNLEDASTIAVGDSLAIAAPIKKYGADIEAVATFVKLNVTSLADAAAAGIAGTGVEGTMIYGQVKSIDTAYNEGYNNITLTLTDGTTDLSCYRLAGGSDIAVGDYLLVTGTPSAYKGAAQMAAGATYNKTGIYVAPEEPEVPEVTGVEHTISFASKADTRTSFSTTEQVWAADGITFTNAKANSTNDVADYENPVRCYAGSTIKIDCTGMLKIVITTAGGKNFAADLTIDGATVVVDGSTTTIVFDAAVDTVTIALTAQVRIATIVVTANA